MGVRGGKEEPGGHPTEISEVGPQCQRDILLPPPPSALSLCHIYFFLLVRFGHSFLLASQCLIFALTLGSIPMKSPICLALWPPGPTLLSGHASERELLLGSALPGTWQIRMGKCLWVKRVGL